MLAHHHVPVGVDGLLAVAVHINLLRHKLPAAGPVLIAKVPVRWPDALQVFVLLETVDLAAVLDAVYMVPVGRVREEELPGPLPALSNKANGGTCV